MVYTIIYRAKPNVDVVPGMESARGDMLDTATLPSRRKSSGKLRELQRYSITSLPPPPFPLPPTPPLPPARNQRRRNRLQPPFRVTYGSTPIESQGQVFDRGQREPLLPTERRPYPRPVFAKRHTAPMVIPVPSGYGAITTETSQSDPYLAALTSARNAASTTTSTSTSTSSPPTRPRRTSRSFLGALRGFGRSESDEVTARPSAPFPSTALLLSLRPSLRRRPNAYLSSFDDHDQDDNHEDADDDCCYPTTRPRAPTSRTIDDEVYAHEHDAPRLRTRRLSRSMPVVPTRESYPLPLPLHTTRTSLLPNVMSKSTYSRSQPLLAPLPLPVSQAQQTGRKKSRGHMVDPAGNKVRILYRAASSPVLDPATASAFPLLTPHAAAPREQPRQGSPPRAGGSPKSFPPPLAPPPAPTTKSSTPSISKSASALKAAVALTPIAIGAIASLPPTKPRSPGRETLPPTKAASDRGPGASRVSPPARSPPRVSFDSKDGKDTKDTPSSSGKTPTSARRDSIQPLATPQPTSQTTSYPPPHRFVPVPSTPTETALTSTNESKTAGMKKETRDPGRTKSIMKTKKRVRFRVLSPGPTSRIPAEEQPLLAKAGF